MVEVLKIEEFNSKEKLSESYDYCYRMMKENSKSFTFASNYLDKLQQRSVAALYAYCRYTDDIANDINLNKEIKIKKLLELENQVLNIKDLEFNENPILHALKDTVDRYDMPLSHLIELINGCRMDLEITEYETIDQLDLYCYRVASIVGVLMCYIAGSTSDIALERAADLGKAMQITNILRDISTDFEMGRVYIPMELREKHNVNLEDIRKNHVTPEFINLIKEETKRAKHYYKLGEEGLVYLPDGFNFSIEVASKVYAEILNEIKRMNYLILGDRAIVSKRRKVWLTFKLKVKRIYFKSPFGYLHGIGVDTL